MFRVFGAWEKNECSCPSSCATYAHTRTLLMPTWWMGGALSNLDRCSYAHMILTLSSFLLFCYSVVHFPLGDNTAALIIVLRFPGRMDTSYGISQWYRSIQSLNALYMIISLSRDRQRGASNSIESLHASAGSDRTRARRERLTVSYTQRQVTEWSCLKGKGGGWTRLGMLAVRNELATQYTGMV
jgi:hypothetical protein